MVQLQRVKSFPGPGWKCRLCGKCSKQSETTNLDYLKTTHEELALCKEGCRYEKLLE
jgi:hypothetical protein